MSFEISVPFHCPLCRQECKQAAPNVPAWHCEGCELTTRVGATQLAAALARRETAAADLDRGIKVALHGG